MSVFSSFDVDQLMSLINLASKKRTYSGPKDGLDFSKAFVVSFAYEIIQRENLLPSHKK